MDGEVRFTIRDESGEEQEIKVRILIFVSNDLKQNFSVIQTVVISANLHWLLINHEQPQFMLSDRQHGKFINKFEGGVFGSKNLETITFSRSSKTPGV